MRDPGGRAGDFAIGEPVILDGAQIHGCEFLQGRSGFGSLDGDLCVAVAVILHHGVEAVLGRDVLEILILIGSVDAQEVVIVGDFVHQDVVDETAVLVEQAGVVGLAEFQLVYGVGGDVVGEFGGFRSANLDLAHVADIEDAHRVAHGVVLVDDSASIGRACPTRRSPPSSHPGRDGQSSGV